MSERILLNDFKAQWKMLAEASNKAFNRVGERGWYILGEEVKRFETQIAALTKNQYAIGCASGLDAIEISLRSLGITQGNYVLTTPLSAFATTLAIYRAGGIPVFVDTESNGQINLSAARAVLDSDRSIEFFVPVHLYGHSLNLNELDQIKNRYSVKVVEDCAQSLGAYYDGQNVGSVGHMSALSFYPTKNLGAMGDAGMVITSSEKLYKLAHAIRDYGQTAKYKHDLLGMNSRLDEVHAAILNDAILPHFADCTERRKKIAAFYLAEIKNAHLKFLDKPSGSNSVYHLFPLLVPKGRAAFMDYMKSLGIETAIHYPTIIPEQPLMKNLNFKVFGELVNAREVANQEVSLPIHPFLTDEQTMRIVEACNKWEGDCTH